MNASSQSAQKLLATHEELRKHQYHNDLLVVMGSAEGRRFVFDLLGVAGVFRQSFSSDALSTAFNEGRRSLGLFMLGRLNDESPDLYLKAQGEFVETQRKEQQLREASEAEAANDQEENE